MYTQGGAFTWFSFQSEIITVIDLIASLQEIPAADGGTDIDFSMVFIFNGYGEVHMSAWIFLTKVFFNRGFF